MAASRGGFLDFFQPLYELNNTSAIDGTLNGIPFLLKVFLPLVEAIEIDDEFAVAQTVKAYSRALSPTALQIHPNPLEVFNSISAKVDALSQVLKENNEQSIISLLSLIATSKLLELPDVFLPIVSSRDIKLDPAEDKREEFNTAWEKALSSPLSSLKSYASYINDKSTYGTHQGVKGLQFPRVLAILDDDNARGFLFNYEKLLRRSRQLRLMLLI